MRALTFLVQLRDDKESDDARCERRGRAIQWHACRNRIVLCGTQTIAHRSMREARSRTRATWLKRPRNSAEGAREGGCRGTSQSSRQVPRIRVRCRRSLRRQSGSAATNPNSRILRGIVSRSFSARPRWPLRLAARRGIYRGISGRACTDGLPFHFRRLERRMRDQQVPD